MRRSLKTVLIGLGIAVVSQACTAGVFGEELLSSYYEEEAFASEEASLLLQEDAQSVDAGEATDPAVQESEELLLSDDLLSVPQEELQKEEILPAAVEASPYEGIVVNGSDWVAEGGTFRLTRHAQAGIDGEAAGDEDVPAEAGDGFFTGADGIVTITTCVNGVYHTGEYLFDDAGNLVTGPALVAAGLPGNDTGVDAWYYFTGADEAVLYDEYPAEVEKTPVTSNFGQKKANYWYFENKRFHYYGAGGAEVSIGVLNSENASVGYFKIGDGYYCLADDGTPWVGRHQIGNALYYFQPDSTVPGKMFLDGWKKFSDADGERWYFFQRESAGGAKGQAIGYTGYHAERILALSASEKYLLDKSGLIVKNQRVKAMDGYYYASDATGRVYRDQLVKLGNDRYYFNETGAQLLYSNQWICLASQNNRYYYFGNEAGKVEEKTGIQRVTDQKGNFIGWFYFDSNGNNVQNTFIGDRYFAPSGKMVKGLRTVSGKTYFFSLYTDASYGGDFYRNTLVQNNGKYYYAQADGTLLKDGWYAINGKECFFKDYEMKLDYFAWKNGVYGYIDSYGSFYTGWLIADDANNKVMYVDPSGNEVYKNTSVVIGGLRYYFDENGFRINDLTNMYSAPYYLRVDRVNGVMTVYNSSGTVPVKSIRVSVGLPGMNTPAGTYYLSRAGRWQSLMGPSWGQYASHVDGAGYGGIYIHSVACTYANSYNLPIDQYNLLGNPASHGCIRCCVGDAYWVYHNCNGARITIFDGNYTSLESMKGPLGRRALVPAYSNFDPTDPNV